MRCNKDVEWIMMIKFRWNICILNMMIYDKKYFIFGMIKNMMQYDSFGNIIMGKRSIIGKNE